MPRAARPALNLSLQFGADPLARTHRSLLPKPLVRRCLREALECPAELAVRIVGLDEARALNRDYRKKDYATNVLTFDYSHAPQVQADLVLCAPVIEEEARALGIALLDHYLHLLVHGALHAQGLDHEDAVEAEQMEARETAVLARLGIADPYARR